MGQPGQTPKANKWFLKKKQKQQSESTMLEQVELVRKAEIVCETEIHTKLIKIMKTFFSKSFHNYTIDNILCQNLSLPMTSQSY